MINDPHNFSLPHTTFSYEVRHIPVKRIFDIVFSSILLLILSPLFLLIGLAIYCSSPGKIIYYQNRIGRGGVPFRCYKFRSMHLDAESRLKDILKNDPKRREEWDLNHKLKQDPRLIPIGSFLRRSSLDELPQFWNVLKGNLSVVGPRPVVQEEIVRHFGVKAYKVFSVRPGITGLWQVSGRSNTDYVRRVALDEQYVNTRSALLDIKIILKTLPSMFSGKGAY